MSSRGWMSSVLMAAVLTATLPASSFAAGSDPARSAPAGKLQAAVTRAAADAAANPSLQLRTSALKSGAKSGARMQSTGGGHAMMIVSLVTAVIGVGATVYAVKELQKT